MMRTTIRSWSRRGLCAGIALLAGCRSSSTLPFESEQSLRHSVVESVRRELAEDRSALASTPPWVPATLEQAGISAHLLPELETLAGIDSYKGSPFPITGGLDHRVVTTRQVDLEGAVRTAVENNLATQFDRLAPALSATRVIAAQGAFDWTFFSNSSWSRTDSPQPRSFVGSTPTGAGADLRQTISATTGLRRRLISGGQFTFQQELAYTDVDTPGVRVVPNPSHEGTYTLQFDQPLLRGFGSDAALAEVRLARNLERDSLAVTKSQLIQTVTQTEEAYWNLVRSYWDVLILQRLLERGVAVRDQLIERRRQRLDPTGAQVADAIARVEERRGNVLRAQLAYTQASDQLKALMNHPEFPVGSEALLVPSDLASVAEGTRFEPLDAMRTAISHRPEIHQAVISLDDTSIRKALADNNRLPQLDLRLQMRFGAIEDRFGESLTDPWDGEFIDYLAGLVFEVPLGNRTLEAQADQRRLERMQAVIAFRNTVQQVMLEVRGSLRNLTTNQSLIAQSRLSRLAQAENYRSFQVEKALMRGFDVTTLDAEFRRQEALAAAERDELQSLVDFNISLARVHAAMGTALERNRIAFVIPDDDSDFGGRAFEEIRNLDLPSR